MSKFKNAFFKVLTEDIDERMSPDDISPDGDAEAFDDSFKNPEDAEEFNTDPNMAGFQDKYVERMTEWKDKIATFLEWLNSPETDSLNKQLIAMDKPQSKFEGISSEVKKITNISKDLASLKETINGVLLKMGQQEPPQPQIQSEF